MIHEFALDPRVLNTWQSARYLLEKFGVEHGRLISKYPTRWQRMVYESCADCGEVERKRIEEMLANVREKIINSKRGYHDELTWLENAESQHRVKPFRAIIAGQNPRNREEILIAEELSEAKERWNIKREIKVSRKAEELAQLISPLLRISNRILFVDRFFDPSKARYRRTLSAFLCNLDANSEIEYHLGDNLDPKYFKDECRKQLGRVIPKYVGVKFIRWQGDMLHARYILTDQGGKRGKEKEITAHIMATKLLLDTDSIR